ncbi:hypothetical protein ACFLUP_03280 [Chloroflexota bacterium]
MSAIINAFKIIALIIIAFFIASIFKLPWPANIIIGGLILISFVIIIIYDFLSRRRKSNNGETGE